MTRGVDVSEYQRAVDWPRLASDGFEFFYARAANGLVPDKLHDAHLVNGRAAGLVGGSYQFGHPSMDVAACADFFLARASLVRGQLRPVVDMEALSEGKIPDNAAAWTDAWCERVKLALERMYPESFGARRGPIVYASTSYWRAMVAMRPALGGPFGWDWWAAQYGGQQPSDSIAWQLAGDVALAGQVGLWDVDQAGDLERLKL